MSYIGGKKIIFYAVFLTMMSCFGGGGVDKRGSVTNYRNGVVLTEGGSFRMGVLGPDWTRKKFSYQALLFQNNQHQASISVSSFCKRAADDASLPVLANQLFYGVTEQKRISENDFLLDGRYALWRTISGKMDGAPLMADAVVLKMNECVFDFVHTAAPADYQSGVADFRRFVEGFHYLNGPRID